MFCGRANYKHCYEVKMGSMFCVIVLKRFYGTIIRAPVARRLVHGLQTNGVATAVKVVPFQSYVYYVMVAC